MDTYIIGCFDSQPIPRMGHNSQAPYPFSQSVAVGNQDKQQALELLYRLGCQHGIDDDDMIELCRLAGVDFEELQNYSGVPA
jgi:hypothetical protein